MINRQRYLCQTNNVKSCFRRRRKLATTSLTGSLQFLTDANMMDQWARNSCCDLRDNGGLLEMWTSAYAGSGSKQNRDRGV